MKKQRIFLFFGFSTLLFNLCEAQNPTYQQKLFYTCKVWGFVKYFHSNVSTCGVNWDSVLLHCLPLIKSAVTQNDFNNALDTMLNAAGPMAITHTPPCDTMAPELKRNLDFGWLNSPILRADVQTILDTIKNNFRPHAECWVQNNNYVNSYSGWLVFPYDSLIINQDFSVNYPDEWHRLLVLFKHWNIVNYFTFNIYIHDIPWDSTLMQNVLNIDTAANDKALNIAFWKIAGEVDDSHTQAYTYDYQQFFPNRYYSPPIVIEYIYPNYVVAKSYVPQIHAGDVVSSINGLTTQQWEDSLKPYVTASDSSATRYYTSVYMSSGLLNQSSAIGYLDSLNNSHSTTLYCDSLYYYEWQNAYYFPNDSLETVHWRYWSNCNIGYVNIGQLESSDVTPLYAQLKNSNAIIIDVRNYPIDFNAWQTLANLMFPSQMANAKFTIPDVTYPGTWYWEYQYSGYNGNPTPYNGTVIILMNQTTQSQAEYVCQTFALLPHAIKVGSQTSGADGNISYYRLGLYVGTGFTTIGTFLPNGDSTQRIGIKPDITMYPTRQGLYQGRDELLEKAFELAGCPLSVPAIKNTKPEITVYPNPSNGQFTFVIASGTKQSQSTIEIYNTLGQKVYSRPAQANDNIINLSGQPSGVYLYRVITETGELIGDGKLVIQK